MRKVLFAKNGVITEERFQKMTTAQWLFHYSEIIKNENEKSKKDADIVNVITSYMELVGSMANPEAGKKLQEIKDQQKNENEVSADTFYDDFMKLKEMIPAKIDIKVEGGDNKYVLPKFDKDQHKAEKIRKLGINKGGVNK